LPLPNKRRALGIQINNALFDPQPSAKQKEDVNRDRKLQDAASSRPVSSSQRKRGERPLAAPLSAVLQFFCPGFNSTNPSYPANPFFCIPWQSTIS